MITLTLPFPPAVNNITTVSRGRKITSKRGRQYREDAVQSIQEQHQGEPLDGRLVVEIGLWPPCRRKRDIDNYSKAILDAITAAGVWVDDELVDSLTIVRRPVVKGGRCCVTIEEVVWPTRHPTSRRSGVTSTTRGGADEVDQAQHRPN